MNRLDDAFDALSTRDGGGGGSGGRGAADVLSGARTVARRRRRQHRAGLAALGAAAVAVVVLGVGSLTGGDDGGVETEGSPATDPSPTVTSSRPGSTTAPGDGTTTPTTTAPTGTTAPTTTAPPAGAGTPTGDAPPPGGRPGAANTGPDGTTLTPMGADEVEALMRPGAVIEDVLITGGNLDVVADDVTLRNFRLEGGGAPYGIRSVDGHTGFVAEDGEILDVASAGFYGRDATLRRLDVHDSDNAAFKLLTGVTVESSWWHHLGRGGGSGLGAQFEVGGGTNALVGNHCEIPVGQSGYDGDSCVQVNGDAPWTVTVEGNWFDGGDNTVDCGGSTGVAVRGNRFGRRLAGQPVMRCPTASANVWDDTGAPIG